MAAATQIRFGLIYTPPPATYPACLVTNTREPPGKAAGGSFAHRLCVALVLNEEQGPSCEAHSSDRLVRAATDARSYQPNLSPFARSLGLALRYHATSASRAAIASTRWWTGFASRRSNSFASRSEACRASSIAVSIGAVITTRRAKLVQAFAVVPRTSSPIPCVAASTTPTYGHTEAARGGGRPSILKLGAMILASFTSADQRISAPERDWLGHGNAAGAAGLFALILKIGFEAGPLSREIPTSSKNECTPIWGGVPVGAGRNPRVFPISIVTSRGYFCISRDRASTSIHTKLQIGVEEQLCRIRHQIL